MPVEPIIKKYIGLYEDIHGGHIAGPLHCVIEDCNIETHWCALGMVECMALGDHQGVAIAAILLSMPLLSDRIEALGFDPQYNDDHPQDKDF